MRPAASLVSASLLFLLWTETATPASEAGSACFLLHEVGTGEVRRSPATACRTRVSPQSTFKIPHALAALDAGIVRDAASMFPYDGKPYPFENWRRDHTLATAMRYSVVWWFQRVARQLGSAREREYLHRFNYGNADSTSGLTTFWLGESLAISPEEQLQFIGELFANKLPVSDHAMRTVREVLVQPQGVVVNASGEHPFAGTWPAGTVVSAKTGSGNTKGGEQVRWLVGHVGRSGRSWLFVSCVIGGDSTPALAAVDLAADALHHEGIL